MKPTNPHQNHARPGRPTPRGFALVVTLSLMILLTVIAVGLLSLSSISLRSASQGDAMHTARANARLALMLAIGDLQKQLGPDTRISATADQVTGSDPSVSTTPKTQRQWAGAYNSWATALPNAARPAPTFLQWFISGDPAKVTTQSYAGTAIGTNPKDSVEIVTASSVGPNGDPVRVPLLTQTAASGAKNNCAWWVSDLGTKGLISPANDVPTLVADTRADQQSVPSFNLKGATSGTAKPFEKLLATDPLLGNVVSLQSGALVADTPENIRGFYHDLTAQNRGLLVNVRKGGFRKDLSMELERPASTPPPLTNANNILYKVGGENGINLQELWAYYTICSQTITGSGATTKGLRRTGSAAFTTGGGMTSGTPHLQVESSVAACKTDDWFYFKQPVIISYQLVLSFQSQVVSVSGKNETRLHLVADPIITFWNPLDVPVVVPTTAFFSVKYWQVPYNFLISVNGVEKTYSFAGIWRSKDDIDKNRSGDSNILSLRAGESQQLVFKPGEVIKVSQVGNSIVKGTSPVDHNLDAKAGFNYGGGVSIPVRDLAGNYVVLSGTDVTVKCRANNLTAGATGQSGREVIDVRHTRHYSLSHHEYYIGPDREASSSTPAGTASLGIGGMSIDWDFGNRRLKYTEDRGQTSPGVAGTKTAVSPRLYADNFKSIFKDIDPLPMTVTSLTTKQPFMMVSYNAKTEAGSVRGSRSLSRFNPKAHLVDFYDLTAKELDMMPYEFSVEKLEGWKNRSLETSTKGGAYFGGAMDAQDGSPSVTTHSVPREPIVSLAAFQHSFANGFDIQKPKPGYATLNSREPMMPQISHAIGNSMAPAVLAKDKVEGTLPGNRPLADHSYLANTALWDDWFLSGITPQNVSTYSKTRLQKQVATDFFTGKAKLPVTRFIADMRGQDGTKLANTYFASATPSAAATNNIASFISVDGMFNVNSTSVEAWKSLLGARKDRPVIVRDANGRESVKPATADIIPVAGLSSPLDNSVAQGTGNFDLNDPAQWVGRRTLSDPEIDRLARNIVKEVRKRGPFISLADFINRRVGTNSDLARAGAVQNALDAADTKINDSYQTGSRATTAGPRFAFPEAEQGAISQGAPGIVKQADILTPIAPILSARSDSFLVRAYGEKVDAAGKVIARAWCEAVVQRSPSFVDPVDVAEKVYTSINTTNKTFGRRFEIVSFRWLSASEA